MDDLQINQPTSEPEAVVDSVDSPQEGEVVQPIPEETPSSEPEIPQPVIPQDIATPPEVIPDEPIVPEPTPEETSVIPESPQAPPDTSQDEPISPEEPTAEDTLNVPPPVLDETGVEMSTIRSDETGDKVYLLREKQRYWIKNPETLAKLGFYLGKEKRLPFSELLAYPEGEPMDLTIPGFIVPWNRPVEEQKSAQPSQIWS